MSIQTEFEMPAPESNGFVKTLNRMGYMTSTLDPFSQAFVDFAAQACPANGETPALDIGAAYGVATLAALEKGARVIANDLDVRHLDLLMKRVPEVLKMQLALQVGAFPHQLKIQPNSTGAALVCRVLHFFTGPQIEEAASALFEWVKPGGQVFVVAETPYLKNWAKFIPIYESRKRNKERWPGFVEDVHSIVSSRSVDLPLNMHLLDDEILTRIFIQAGFVIERCQMFARPEFPLDLQLDGRESVGLIARKP